MKAPPLALGLSGYQAERKRLSREVHDRIGQPLTVLKLNIERIVKSPGPNAQLLEEMRALVVNMLSDFRNLCLSLEPALDNADIRWALCSLVATSCQNDHLQVDFQHEGLQETVSISVTTSQAIIAIVQEALTNVHMHAGVNKATVKIWNTREEMRVRIEDRGAGFDPANLTNPPYGLASMQEVANLVSGKLTIESAPGAGTRVTARLPLSGPRRKRR